MRFPLALVVLLASACGEDTVIEQIDSVPRTYEFTSRSDGLSSVSYSGQVFRQLLIKDVKDTISQFDAQVDAPEFSPSVGEIEATLLALYNFSDDNLSRSLPLGSDVALSQTNYGNVSSNKNLFGKMAGQDGKGQHKDWSIEYIGMDGASSPDAQVKVWFAELDAMMVDRAVNTNVVVGPNGAVDVSYVTADGRDLKQLIEKFLRGAIALSQGADDYLDDDIDGKGLLSDHTQVVDGKNYTELEHAWDEGFGYFGAARDYLDYEAEEIASGSGRAGFGIFHDSNDDGEIDITAEYNFGHSVNAAKRDVGANASEDLRTTAFEAFVLGRRILAGTDEALTDAQLEDLRSYRDQALWAWEAAVAATIIHYVNDTLQDMQKFGTDDYDFENHAKHWSELKGFLLGLQFNPHSPVSDTLFADINSKVGDAPVLPGVGDADAYRGKLRDVRAALISAYGFDPANAGDTNGEGGW